MRIRRPGQGAHNYRKCAKAEGKPRHQLRVSGAHGTERHSASTTRARGASGPHKNATRAADTRESGNSGATEHSQRRRRSVTRSNFNSEVSVERPHLGSPRCHEELPHFGGVQEATREQATIAKPRPGSGQTSVSESSNQRGSVTRSNYQASHHKRDRGSPCFVASCYTAADGRAEASTVRQCSKMRHQSQREESDTAPTAVGAVSQLARARTLRTQRPGSGAPPSKVRADMRRDQARRLEKRTTEQATASPL